MNNNYIMTSSYSINLILDKLNIDIQYEIIEKIINNSEYDEKLLLHILLYAVKSKNLDLIKFLFEKFNNIDIIKYGSKIFIKVLDSEDLNIIKYFIENGFEIIKYYYYISNNKTFIYSPFHSVIIKKNISIIKYFFKITKNINFIIPPLEINERKCIMDPLLLVSIISKDYNIFKFLIENGIDINYNNDKGENYQSILINYITNEKNKTNIKIYIKMLDYLKKINTNINIIKKENLNDCAICLDDYKLDDNILILNCNHNFHEKCIENLIPNQNQDNLCPLCRKTIN